MARRPGLVVNERVKRDLGLGDFACVFTWPTGGTLEIPAVHNLS